MFTGYKAVNTLERGNKDFHNKSYFTLITLFTIVRFTRLMSPHPFFPGIFLIPLRINIDLLLQTFQGRLKGSLIT